MVLQTAATQWQRVQLPLFASATESFCTSRQANNHRITYINTKPNSSDDKFGVRPLFLLDSSDDKFGVRPLFLLDSSDDKFGVRPLFLLDSSDDKFGVRPLFLLD